MKLSYREKGPLDYFMSCEEMEARGKRASPRVIQEIRNNNPRYGMHLKTDFLRIESYLLEMTEDEILKEVDHYKMLYTDWLVRKKELIKEKRYAVNQ